MKNHDNPQNWEKNNYIPSNRFYTEKEEVTLRFYQTPKALFNNPRYKNLPLGPKLMYSILRDRLDLSIKNNWKDEKGYIYLIFSIEELSSLLEIDRKAVMRYKKKLVDYKLIIDKRLGQGNPNRIYVLKPELFTMDNQKSQKGTSKSPNTGHLKVPNKDTNDTNVSDTKFISNVNNASSNKLNKKQKRSPEKESLATFIAEELEDDHSLGFYRKIVDLIPGNIIYVALSEVKDTHLTGKIKKNKAALFNAIIQIKAKEKNINLNIKK